MAAIFLTSLNGAMVLLGLVSPLRADETFYLYVTDRFNCKRMILCSGGLA